MSPSMQWEIKVPARYIVFSDTTLTGVPGRGVGVPHCSLVEDENLGCPLGQEWVGTGLQFFCCCCLFCVFFPVKFDWSRALSHFLQVFILVGCSFLVLWLESWLLLGLFLLCTHSHFLIPNFFTAKCETYEAKGNPENSPPCYSSSSKIPRQSASFCASLSPLMTF